MQFDVTPFVVLLRRLQREAGVLDKAFGETLGLTESGWNHVKHGRRQPGFKAITGAFAAHPDRHLELAAALVHSSTRRLSVLDASVTAAA